MNRKITGSLLVLMLIGISQDVFALRCGTRLVDKGDSISRAVRYCPEPFWVERRESPGVQEGYYYGYGYHVVDALEIWYVNLGPRKLMRRLVFRNGYLDREDKLDYGFRENSRLSRCNARELEAAGNTLGEVYARCGSPDYEYSYPVNIYPRYQTELGSFRGSPVTIYRYVWTYDMGRQLDRELHFEEGRLVQINRLRD